MIFHSKLQKGHKTEYLSKTKVKFFFDISQLDVKKLFVPFHLNVQRLKNNPKKI